MDRWVWRGIWELEKSFNEIAPVLKAVDWNKVFHMHEDAFAYAIGCILAQPHEHNVDFLVFYANRQLNDVKKNYTTIECEGLTMFYVVEKFWHYLLANHFIFFNDHQALLYLDKPCAIERIVCWFVILLEFDFLVAIQPRSTHQQTNHLSCVMSGEALMGVEDDFPDSTLFLVETAPC